MAELDPAILAILEDIVGADRVLTDAESLQRYGGDWTRVYTPNPAAVLLPDSIEQVQAIVRLAEGHSIEFFEGV